MGIGRWSRVDLNHGMLFFKPADSVHQLRELPPGIGNLTSLTSLLLAGNPLGELPSEIGKLTDLTYLQLTGCSLTSLPSEIGNLTNLVDLLMDNN